MSIIERWPLFLRELYEFQNIAAAEQPEIDAAIAAARELPKNFSIYTLTLAGVERWESILGIATRETETLEERRFRIITKIIAQLPYTYRRLEELLSALCGDSGYSMELNAAAYTLTVKVAVERAKNYNDVLVLVNSIVPANMVVNVMQLFNRWADYGEISWNSVSALTWNQMRKEVIGQ